MSNDITGDLDLLGDWLDAKGYTEEAGLCTRAMDEINKLRAALKRLHDAAIEAQDEGMSDELDAWWKAELRAAKAALGESDE